MANWKYTVYMDDQFPLLKEDEETGVRQLPIHEYITIFIKRVMIALPEQLRRDAELQLGSLQDLVDEAIANEEDIDPDEFDAAMAYVYNWADSIRLWIKVL